MSWTVEIKEIRKPSLVVVTVSFRLNKDGMAYVTDEVSITPEELSGKTNAEKLAYIKGKIELKCDPYILTEAVANGLEQYVGSTFSTS